MAKEPFLINPPKRVRKSNVGLKRHRILGLENKRGDIFSSSRAKLVRKGVKLNPFGELMFVGANPFKEVKSMAHKRRKMHSYASLFGRNPKRKKYHRRYRRNPAMNLGLSKSTLSMIAAGSAGIVATRMIPKLIPVLNVTNPDGTTSMVGYGVKAAIVIGGGMAISKFVNKAAGEGWLIGSAASFVTEVLKDVLKTPLLSGLGLDLSEEAPILVAYQPGQVGEYENSMGDGGVGMYEAV